jgi:hypothetical protein
MVWFRETFRNHPGNKAAGEIPADRHHLCGDGAPARPPTKPERSRQYDGADTGRKTNEGTASSGMSALSGTDETVIHSVREQIADQRYIMEAIVVRHGLLESGQGFG